MVTITKELAYAIVHVAKCGIYMTDKIVTTHNTEEVLDARETAFEGTVFNLYDRCKFFDKIYRTVYDDVDAVMYVEALKVLSEDNVVEVIMTAMLYLRKVLDSAIRGPFDAVVTDLD